MTLLASDQILSNLAWKQLEFCHALKLEGYKTPEGFRVQTVRAIDGAMLPMVLQGFEGDCLLKKALEVAPFLSTNIRQDVEKILQRRSRIARRGSTYRSVRLVSSLLRPCWKAFLNILWVMRILRWYSRGTAQAHGRTHVLRASMGTTCRRIGSDESQSKERPGHRFRSEGGAHSDHILPALHH